MYYHHYLLTNEKTEIMSFELLLSKASKQGGLENGEKRSQMCTNKFYEKEREKVNV